MKKAEAECSENDNVSPAVKLDSRWIGIGVIDTSEWVSMCFRVKTQHAGKEGGALRICWPPIIQCEGSFSLNSGFGTVVPPGGVAQAGIERFCAMVLCDVRHKALRQGRDYPPNCCDPRCEDGV